MREDGLSQTRGGGTPGPTQELGLPAAGVAREALRRRASGPGSRAADADGGAGDRPVARGQPIGSPRCGAARGAQRRRSSEAWSACILESVTAEQRQFVLAKPREALGHVRAAEPKGWDPRLSTRGNRVSKQLAALLDRLAWVENFLECRGWTSLMASDRLVLGPIFERLARDARCVAEGAGDLAVEMHRAMNRHLDSSDRDPLPRRCVDPADRPEPADQPPHRPPGAGAARAGAHRRSARGVAATGAAARQPARRPRSGDRRRCWRVIPRSRRNGSTRNCAGSVTRAAIRSSPNACGGCGRGRSSRRCGGSRPPRGSRHRWITPPMISISRSKDAAASTPSATCWVTRGGSTSTSSNARTSPRPSASTSAPSSTWVESRRLAFMTT